MGESGPEAGGDDFLKGRDSGCMINTEERIQVIAMTMRVTFDHWMEDGWYAGMLKEVSGVFSQNGLRDKFIRVNL
jgi:hypothetical protein